MFGEERPAHYLASLHFKPMRNYFMFYGCGVWLSCRPLHGQGMPRRLEIPEDTDPNLKDLLVRMLDKNPETRITIPEIAVCVPTRGTSRPLCTVAATLR
jgi:serine/threonine protein kinase